MSPIQIVYRIPGPVFNLGGRDLNGTALNDTVLDGHHIVLVSLNDVSVRGRVEDAWIDGSQLEATHGMGKNIVGAVFSGKLDNGDRIPVRVEAVETGTDKWNKDVYRYAVSYGTKKEAKPLCGLDASGEPVKAIALQGRWNYGTGKKGGDYVADDDAFTFACEGYVLAKCVEMGYKPWTPALKCVRAKACVRTTLSDLHEACTRALRADYCGDGVSHTVNGTPINAYDAFSVRVDTLPWAFEAEWGPDGASCVIRDRIAQPLPACAAKLASDDCGDPDDFHTGTLLMTEVQ